MIQKITIDVDIPEGYDAIDFRLPLVDDIYRTMFGTAVACSRTDIFSVGQERIILRKKWAFPAWFKSGWWLFKTQPGTWYVGQNNWFYGSDTTAFYAPLLWEFHGQEFESPIGVKELQCQR